LRGNGEPPSLAVDEDVCEADFRKYLSVAIRNCVQSTDVADLSVHVRLQIAQLIASETAVSDVCQALSALTDLSIRVDILEFVRQNAADCFGIVALKSLRPRLLKLDQRSLTFRLPGWTIGAEGRRANQKREP
jgi:hypothetical protein